MPTKKADGEPLQKSTLKKLDKEFTAAQKAREKVLARCECGDAAAFLQGLRDQVRKLTEEIEAKEKELA